MPGHHHSRVTTSPATRSSRSPSSAVIAALPSIQHSLHATETGITWLLTGYLLSASVGTAILGRLGDMCVAPSDVFAGQPASR